MEKSPTTHTFPAESSEEDIMGFLTIVLYDGLSRFKVAFRSTTTSLVRLPASSAAPPSLPGELTGSPVGGGWGCRT
jgi:hypothetical protein